MAANENSWQRFGIIPVSKKDIEKSVHMIRCYVIGAESLLIHCAQTLLDRGFEVLGVVTSAKPIASWAGARGLPVMEPAPHLQHRLVQPFDYLFSITNLMVLSPEVLALPSRGTINFHDGPLPRYAGLYATAWALMGGETEHGITWHHVASGIDDGNVLLQRRFPLGPADTSFTLNTRCYEAAIESFPQLLDILSQGDRAGAPQDLSRRSYFGRLDRPRAAGIVPWSEPASHIVNLVRALDFGPVDNPFCSAKIWLGHDVLIAGEAEAVTDRRGPPGVVLEVGQDRVVIGTTSDAVALSGLRRVDGPVVPSGAVSGVLRVGQTLPMLDPDSADHLTSVYRSICKAEPFWIERLKNLEYLQLPGDVSGQRASTAAPNEVVLELTADVLSRGEDFFVAGVATFLSRLCQRGAFHVGYRHAGVSRMAAGLESVLSSTVPLRVDLTPSESFDAAFGSLTAQAGELRTRGTYCRDVFSRYPRLQGPLSAATVCIDVSGGADAKIDAGGSVICLDVNNRRLRWLYDAIAFDGETIRGFAESCRVFLDAAVSEGHRPLRALPLLSTDQRDKLRRRNDTARTVSGPTTVPEAFERQVARSPFAVAVSAGSESLTFAELEARSNRLANHLLAEGVKAETLVGIALDRSVDLVVAVLGVLKARGAYVPIDPTYPLDRITFMLEDTAMPIVLSNGALIERLQLRGPRVILLDAEDSAIAAAPSSPPSAAAAPEQLAYTLYTSGSTGRPKGVMVEHRNVMNFFAGMDDCLGTGAGVWLSVTSLSFDISVLELLWSLCRGFHLVLHTDRADATVPSSRNLKPPVSFSLMFFASGAGRDESALDQYQLLLEAAKYGDLHGFSAVWTPERHFHAFGGLYPNPSVASGALATITHRIGLRAGSVVSPLHHPVRIAEEWAFVDNLSRGRVGLSFAAGWQPTDFVLRPEAFADRKAQMFRDIDVVRRLWRGEAITLRSPVGGDASIKTLPRPVQAELPVWVTAAGNPETFVEAAKVGAGVLTHLLGQSIEEVAEKITLYRATWRETGHPDAGTITLMLHTFVGPDSDVVRETVRQPMKEYLRSAVSLIKAAAWTFPTFKQRADSTGKTPAEIFDSQELTPEEMDALLDHAFERYYHGSGLFGTPESCIELVRQLQRIGVDEIACLLDYGIPAKVVLEHLPFLNEVRESCATPQTAVGIADPTPHASLGREIVGRAVTHLQCTPSQLSLILASPEDRAALGLLQTICIGGEAFPPSLASELRAVTDARIWNMYGPTETTIWSSTYPVTGTESRMPIGRPIANTQFHILDEHLQPLPDGAVGELYIGGAGVARGYYQRAELTAERFVPDPWCADSRMYRTGDLARWRTDGAVDFLGRADFQIKVRGYRIELGEIEAAVQNLPFVRESVVVAREDAPGDKRIVAYVTIEAGRVFDVEAAREGLVKTLPEFMVPSAVVVLDSFPLTPNGKVDRKNLPPPERLQRRRGPTYATPATEAEETVAAVWRELLNVAEVGRDDNFFDLGGHSLLAVQAHRRLQQTADKPLALTDLFRFPTIRMLAAHLGRAEPTLIDSDATRRGSQRRAGLMNRQRSRDTGPRQ